MKTFLIRTYLINLIFLVLFSFTSCKKNNTINPLVVESSDLKDLTDFPKSWVLLINDTPDSIISHLVVPVGIDSSFFGKMVIEPKDTAWQMTYQDSYSANIYTITKCEKVMEAEMIYYNFELLSNETKLPVTLQVNFRDNADNPQSSVFFFKNTDGTEGETYELVSEVFSKNFPRKVQEEYD